MPRYLSIDYLSKSSEKYVTDINNFQWREPHLEDNLDKNVLLQFYKPWTEGCKLKPLSSSKIVFEKFYNYCDNINVLQLLRDLESDGESSGIKNMKMSSDKNSICSFKTFNLSQLREEILLGDSRNIDEIILEDPLEHNFRCLPHISDMVSRLTLQKLVDILPSEDLTEFEICSKFMNFSHLNDIKIVVLKEQIEESRAPAANSNILKLPLLLDQRKLLMDRPENDFDRETQIEANLTNHCETPKLPNLQMSQTASFKSKDDNFKNNSQSNSPHFTEFHLHDMENHSQSNKQPYSDIERQKSQTCSTKTKIDFNENSKDELNMDIACTSEQKKFKTIRNSFDLFINGFFAVKYNDCAINQLVVKPQPIIARPREINELKENKTVKIIRLRLTNEYETILFALERHAKQLINCLQTQLNSISCDNDFHSLTPDMTKFLLNQYIMHYKEDISQTSELNENYCKLLALHGIVQAAECVTHRSLKCALSCMRLYQDEHQIFLKDYFDEIRRNLSQIEITYAEKHIVHPKVKQLFTIVKCWLQKQSDERVLIIVKNWTIHFDFISEIIQSIPNAKMSTSEKGTVTIDQIIISNVVIIGENFFDKKFLWREFVHVLMYEYHETTTDVEGIIKDYQLDFVGLVMDKTRDNTETMSNIQLKFVQLSLICSSEILKRLPDLIKQLEYKENVQLLKRDYDKLQEGQIKHLVFCDITIDEETGILIRSFSDVSDNFNDLLKVLLGLSLKFNTCWLILHTAAKNSTYDDKIAKLHVARNILAKYYSFYLKVIYAGDVDQMAKMVRYIGDAVFQKKQHNITSDDNTNICFKPQFTRHEKFLLCCPSLNSASAQVLLAEAPLKSILKMSLEELLRRIPRVPERFLIKFHQLIHRKSIIYQKCFSRENICAQQQDNISDHITNSERSTHQNNFEIDEKFSTHHYCTSEESEEWMDQPVETILSKTTQSRCFSQVDSKSVNSASTPSPSTCHLQSDIIPGQISRHFTLDNNISDETLKENNFTQFSWTPHLKTKRPRLVTPIPPTPRLNSTHSNPLQSNKQWQRNTLEFSSPPTKKRLTFSRPIGPDGQTILEFR